MTPQVVLVKTDEGYSVSARALPECFSEGETEEEALANIEDAIRDYVGVKREVHGYGALLAKVTFHEVQVG